MVDMQEPTHTEAIDDMDGVHPPRTLSKLGLTATGCSVFPAEADSALMLVRAGKSSRDGILRWEGTLSALLSDNIEGTRA